MYHFIRKNNKKLLAIFAAGLMVVFILPSGFRNPNQYGANVLGTFPGGQKLTVRDVQNAQYEWRLLTYDRDHGVIVVPNARMNPTTGKPEAVPLVQMILPEQAIAEIQRTENAPMFSLLLKEAHDMGVRVPQEQVDQLLNELAVATPSGQVLQLDGVSEETKDDVRATVHDLLLVSAAVDRAANTAVKVSQPLVNTLLAEQAQEIKLRLVDFHARDYAGQVAPPTQQQMLEQFKKYKDVLPAEFDTSPQNDPFNPQPADSNWKQKQDSNPFGFGYKYPDRVKLQYISISRDEVRKGIRASKSEYDWDVEAQKVYQKNPKQFAASQPATQPTTSTAAQARNTPATAPAIKPFAEVRDQILASLIDPQVDATVRSAQGRITSQMAADYVALRNAASGAATAPSATAPASAAAPTTLPNTAKAPMTALGVRYDSPQYLPKLAELIQREFKFLPTVVSLQDKFLDRNQLAELPGIGKAEIRGREGFLPFSTYAIDYAAPFHPGGKPEELIQLLEPSRPLADEQSIYIFRLTAADPTHPPKDLAEVQPRVEQDLRTAAAYDLAKQAAQKTLEQARAKDLRSAAQSAGKQVVETGYLMHDARFPVLGFEVPANSRQRFVDEAFQLLEPAAKDPNQPAFGLVQLPRDGTVLVAALADVRLEANPTQLAAMRTQLARQEAAALSREMYDTWFSYDAVKQRTNFEETAAGRRNAG